MGGQEAAIEQHRVDFGQYVLAALLAVFGLAILPSAPARADGILGVTPDSQPPFDSSTFPIFFPNWKMAPVAVDSVYECDDTVCTACTAATYTGLTIVNFGTATGGAGGDITGTYWRYGCAAGLTAVQTLTYAGVWTVGGSPHPVWTWGGSVAQPNDPCTACFCFGSLQIFADIAPCPVDGATVALGPSYDTISAVGGFMDSCGYNGPTELLSPEPREIHYTYKKVDLNVAAPGDTVTYQVFYGLPGTVPLTSIVVTDSLPPFTHYASGTGAPLPDVGWDPDIGPPPRLRWTINGPITPGAGPTGVITFSATLDWGNGEAFEPGSGDVAAPEGASIENAAHVSWTPSAGVGSCPAGQTSNTVGTTVRRFLFWMIGDNDLLFASRIGAPDDEMTYSIFVQNVSSQKAWWNVTLWDTVPPEMDVWGGSAPYGFNDPCVGWTMTPTGCSPASPGRVTAGGKTILTWKLDMPPGATIQLQWKVRVQTTAPAGSTAISILSLLELGKTGISGGTGNSTTPKNFVQLATIKLRTTYLSYVSVSTINSLGNDGWFLDFYPLNKATTFELRCIQYAGVPYATTGGVTNSIGCLIGDCLGGFAGSAGCTLGSGAIPGGGRQGCTVERIPAMYTAYSTGLAGSTYGNCADSTLNGSSNPAIPYHVVFKVTSNSPILWQFLSGVNDTGNDQFTYDPTTSLSYSGFTVYGFLRHGAQATSFDMLNLVNTSVGPTDVLDPTLATTVHIFNWDYASNTWIHITSYEVGAEAQVEPYIMKDTCCNMHFRVISSQTKLVSHHGWCALNGPDANNLSHMSPTRNSGMLISGTAEEAFYLFPGPWDSYEDVRAEVTNAGASLATYRIERYQPRNPLAVPPSNNCGGIPLWLSDTYGSWVFVKRDTVPAGMFPGSNTPPNPHSYGTMYDVPIFDAPGNSAGMWRIVLESGGPIQVCSGGDMMAVWSGGSVLHPSVPLGAKVGTEFWLSESYEWAGVGCNAGPSINTIAVFCPKSGMSANCVTNLGYSATYTTNGPDQCIAFMGFTLVAASQKRNTKITVTGGNAMVNYNHCIKNHKVFTAPFMETGVHYDILTPSSVYIGQSFWITIVVVDSGGGTKTDYCGTTSFTSTDPGAKIENNPMDIYNFTFSSTSACSVSPNEDGVKVFVNVSMTQLGLQTIVASDISDGSITGITSIMVVGVDVKLTKKPPLSVAASGDIPQFQICWSNYSSTSAFSFVITDAVPMGTTFLPEAGTAQLVCSQAAGVVVDVAYSTSTSATPPAGFVTGNPIANTRWLRWTVKHVGVNTTGCACFRVTVN